MTTIDTITDYQIEALRTEAADAGDSQMIEYCDRALAGDDAALSECVDAIRAAEAMAL